MSDARDEVQAQEGRQMRLGDIAYEQMKERLIRGAFPPGHKLTIRAVATELDVSTTPARDAINRLELEGALVYAGAKTVIVPQLSMAALREVTLMRLALEGLAAEQAVVGVSAGDLSQLKHLQGQISTALDDGRYGDALWSNKEFHFTIYRLAGMPHLLATIEAQWLRIGASFNDLYPEFATTRYGVHNHESAIEALGDRDAPAVRAAIENDIRDGFRQLRRAYEGREEGSANEI